MEEGQRVFPIKVSSWEILSPVEFQKKTDKSVFHHHGTAIPAELAGYFEVAHLGPGGIQEIKLEHQGKIYRARIETDHQLSLRRRLFWKSDFALLLKEELPGWFEIFSQRDNHNQNPPLIHFSKVTPFQYKVSFLKTSGADEPALDKSLCFEWQGEGILSEEKTNEVEFQIILHPEENTEGLDMVEVDGGLIYYQETSPPDFAHFQQVQESEEHDSFKGRHINFAEINSRNAECGTAGERFVIQIEKEVLSKNQRSDLAGKVRHVAQIEGDGTGYDVESYTLNGEFKYIEVKTTSGGKTSPFYMSANELKYAMYVGKNYYLYRVYDFDEESGSGKYYILTSEDITKNVKLEPTQFRVSVKH